MMAGLWWMRPEQEVPHLGLGSRSILYLCPGALDGAVAAFYTGHVLFGRIAWVLWALPSRGFYSMRTGRSRRRAHKLSAARHSPVFLLQQPSDAGIYHPSL